ncbi:MAG: peptide chain release factor N(5)-glutamine methyltransferase [Pseudomonadota bacterium]
MQTPINLGAAWRFASEHLARNDARRLVEYVCACRHADLLAHPERPLSAAEAAQLAALLERAAQGEPLAYLLGSACFYDLEFEVSPAVLIPRPETELLVSLGLQALQETLQGGVARPCVLELGTGSGIVAVSLALHCAQAEINALDVSSAALAIARGNAERHAAPVRLIESNWFAQLGAEFFGRSHLIVSNPPYIAHGDPHLSQNGLPFEPSMALSDGVAGGNGLSCIEQIICAAPTYLSAQGHLLLEHGYDQAEQVRALLSENGFSQVRSWLDDNGIERVSGGRKAA